VLTIAAALVACPALPASAATGPDCTWHQQNDSLAHCVSVTVSMTQAPVTGQTVPISFTVAAEIAEQGIQVEADLPGNVKWASVPQGLTVQTVQTGNRYDRGSLNRAAGTITLDKGAQLTFTGTVTPTGTGSTEIRVRATYATALGPDTVSDNVYVTIDDKKSSFGIPVPAVVAIAATGTSAQGVATKAKQVPQGPSPDSTTCVTGGFVYEDSAGAWHPVRSMFAEAWQGTTRLATATTGSTGRFTLCLASWAGGSVSIHFVTTSFHWQVRQAGTTQNFTFGSADFFVPATGGNVELGTFASCDHAFDRLLWAYDTAYQAKNWRLGGCWDALDSTCQQLIIFWSPSSTDGTHFVGREVHLTATDPADPARVLRQIAHAVMYDVYEGAYPATPSCSPHSIYRRSSAGCAWVEGFADWYAAQILNNPGANGFWLNYPTWGALGIDTGDAVELRVGAALWHVADTARMGYDQYGEGADNLWYTFLHHRSTTFAEFWNQRIADGFDNEDTGALGSLYQSTIDYRFRDYLVDYTSQSRPNEEPWPHLYRIDTATPYWSVVAAAPSATEDLILTLFANRDISPGSFLVGSDLPDRTIEFIAIDSFHRRPFASYYPRVDKVSGEGPDRVIFAQGSNFLLPGTSQDITVDTALVRDVCLTGGVSATITLGPGDPYADGELFLMQVGRDAHHPESLRGTGQCGRERAGRLGEHHLYAPDRRLLWPGGHQQGNRTLHLEHVVTPCGTDSLSCWRHSR
jgi:hypothetical protein